MSLNLMAIGDSKTVGSPFNVATNGYRDPLIALMNSSEPGNDVEFSGVLAAGSKTTAMTLADFPAFAAAQTQSPDHVLVNLGTVDLDGVRAGTITEGNWAMGDLLDLIHAEWPSAQVWLMRVLRTDFVPEQTTLNDTWIPNVLASRSAWAAVGPDERTFLPGYLTDTTHPTSVGYDRTAAQWREVIVSYY